MRSLSIIFVFASVAAAIVETAHAQPTPVISPCPQDTVSFRGHCVSQNECCVEGVCPEGQIFEFGAEPKCVPCAEAQSQTAMNICAGTAAHVAESKRKSVVSQVAARLPELRGKLERMEKAWLGFRDKWCDLVAAEYEGGSMQPLIHSNCLEASTNEHVSQLQELRRGWESR